MEEIFFSGTFGGELLSLAAAKSVLTRYREEKIVEKLSYIGQHLATGVSELISKYGLQEVLQLSGHPTWIFLNWTPTKKYSVNQIKTLFMQEMFANGILILSTHNVTLAMDSKVIQRILFAYDKTLEVLANAINQQNLEAVLCVSPLEPLFKVR
jgi:glutamate-1-semialdehyde aminotransferase